MSKKKRGKRTLEMAFMKFPSLNEPPRSFSSKPVMKNIIGVMKPSPTAPISPSPISIQSTPSACINIDRKLPQLFIFNFSFSLSSQLFQRKELTAFLFQFGGSSRVMLFHVFLVVFYISIYETQKQTAVRALLIYIRELEKYALMHKKCLIKSVT